MINIGRVIRSLGQFMQHADVSSGFYRSGGNGIVKQHIINYLRTRKTWNKIPFWRQRFQTGNVQTLISLRCGMFAS